MKTFATGLLALLLLLGGSQRTAVAAQSSEQFEGDLSRHARLRYLLFIPAEYAADARRSWPLILYLHGGSLRGTDPVRLTTMGLPHRLEKDTHFPFIVVAPVCPEGEIWTDVEAIGALIDRVKKDYRLDEDRIYVTGHSMGGRGALYYAYRMPDRFAAVVALSPISPINAWAKTLGKLPIWIIHGEEDSAAPIHETEELVREMEKAGGHPRFTPLPNRDHFILDWYDRNDIFDWLSKQRRKTTPRS